MFDRRVLVVSGKGGVGKTAVSAACARAAARGGKRVLLVETEGRDGLSQLLGIPGPGFAERPTRFGFSVLSITPREALLEYLWLFFHMKTLARALRRAKVVEVATEAIPGFRDLMAAGKLYELTDWRDRSGRSVGRRPWDFLVVDAPPTGQIVPFLRSPSAYRELIRVGRPNRQLASIEHLLRHDARVALVAVPEEMSVAETLETVAALDAEGFTRGPVLVNQVEPAPFPRGVRAPALRMDAPALAGVLRSAGVECSEPEAGSLLVGAREQDDRARARHRYVERLAKTGPVVELPFVVSEAFGPNEVDVLADALESRR